MRGAIVPRQGFPLKGPHMTSIILKSITTALFAASYFFMNGGVIVAISGWCVIGLSAYTMIHIIGSIRR
jgi:hypothetical protein